MQLQHKQLLLFSFSISNGNKCKYNTDKIKKMCQSDTHILGYSTCIFTLINLIVIMNMRKWGYI